MSLQRAERMVEPATTKAIENLSARWNEPEISSGSVLHWLEQFEASDHAIALQLLDCMEMHSWARLIRECRLLHERLCRDLGEDGFDVEHFSDIDFTRAFVCKSGDLIAYVYRKANRIPVSCFKNIEALHSTFRTEALEISGSFQRALSCSIVCVAAGLTMHSARRNHMIQPADIDLLAPLAVTAHQVTKAMAQ